MAQRLRLGALQSSHRSRVAEILAATAVFRDEELDVALELFDESVTAVPRSAPADYVFVGAFAADDTLTGFACYGPTPGTDRGWDLYWIAVDPAVQRSGAGSVLLAEVERRLEDLGARMLVIETSSRAEYSPTRAFYAGRAYTQAARVRDFYAPADDRIIYTKRFPAGPVRAGVMDR